METVQPLERLQVLEKKIALLIDLLKMERERSHQFEEEKNVFAARVDAMESSLLKETKSSEEFSQERALTKMMVDELIQTIDQIVDTVPEAKASSEVSL